MRNKYFFLSILLLHSFASYCQDSPNKSFSLDGIIIGGSGQIELTMVADSNYYPKSVRHLKAPIVNGKFRIEGQIPYPIAYKLSNGNDYFSEMIILEPGSHSVTCDYNVKRDFPQMDNHLTKEYIDYRNTFKENIEKTMRLTNERKKLVEKYPSGLPDSIKRYISLTTKELYAESDKALLSYVKDHPLTYFGFWRVIALIGFGYEDIYSEIYAYFDNSLKNNYSGKYLFKMLQNSSQLRLGKKFPNINLLALNEQPAKNFEFSKQKYTLVDFWYSHCRPCIAQLPSFVKTYGNYKTRGFEIYSISTDAIKYKDDLKNGIIKHEMQWAQYWDIDGKETTALSIIAFPTNYLLDTNGIIIQKNISPEQLDEFLKKNL